ncbi:penicillin-insensitive murein endopeptidase [Bradyrhizobium sp. SSUT18]|uniref:penicillin-insensitive murein endopeptidase n=1 Tax=Bradyrhizobium sp. SSUT18 TaxID=3040602 RepID=UPI00244BA952|nr:penicillin-insensitive murein endopeptidase [Bradyrhizobium sp. SSUT18]MDH2401310.1 penicillin-insensitive murein endopeptidase [Bradyrhizobium sp. SSUT18]
MHKRHLLIMLAIPVAALTMTTALCQDKGSVDRPAPLANPSDPKLGAKELFGRKTSPAPLATRSIGFYAKGCLAGAQALPINGETWQVMRLSRNRNWAHPDMVALLERLSVKAHEVAGWPGLLVGDMSQPRGGPMLTGHASHQVGLDADIWLTPMPNRQLSRNEREEMSATSMVRTDRLDIDPAVWTPSHLLVIRAAAQEPRVERIFVNAAIKKALCREAKGDRSWLAKVRPMYGHDYHFHVRITCPPGDSACTPQPRPSEDEGCAPADFAYWLSDPVIHPRPSTEPAKPAPPITLAQLPAACRQILLAP